MFIYTVRPMPGQKAKSEGDPSIKYQVRRVNTDIPANKSGHSVIIRTNLAYDAAMALIEKFNDMEGKSQTMREEEAERKKALE